MFGFESMGTEVEGLPEQEVSSYFVLTRRSLATYSIGVLGSATSAWHRWVRWCGAAEPPASAAGPPEICQHRPLRPAPGQTSVAVIDERADKGGPELVDDRLVEEAVAEGGRGDQA